MAKVVLKTIKDSHEVMPECRSLIIGRFEGLDRLSKDASTSVTSTPSHGNSPSR